MWKVSWVMKIALKLESEERWGMAETKIILGDQVIGYVGASRYTDTTEEAAHDAVMDVLAPLIKAIQDHPAVRTKSRFDKLYE